MNYELPKSLVVCGAERAIRTDYRAVLDICAALSEVEATDFEKSIAALKILYIDFDSIPYEHYAEALQQCFWFINCGENSQQKKSVKLMDWEKDFKYIVSPVNRVIGKEIRSLDYLHWWTFISAYYEIGDCTFAHVVRIRDKKARGEKLDKQEEKWYRQNRDIVDIKNEYTAVEEELLEAWK